MSTFFGSSTDIKSSMQLMSMILAIINKRHLCYSLQKYFKYHIDFYIVTQMEVCYGLF